MECTVCGNELFILTCDDGDTYRSCRKCLYTALYTPDKPKIKTEKEKPARHTQTKIEIPEKIEEKVEEVEKVEKVVKAEKIKKIQTTMMRLPVRKREEE